MSSGTKAGDESWAAAHEVSQQLVLQAAMEDVEKKAVKLEHELSLSLKENEKQSEELRNMQQKVDDLEASLRSQSTKLQAVQDNYERSTSALESMRLADGEKDARFDRLQQESDALRDEIGRLNAENTEYRSKLNETEAQVKLDNTEIAPLRYEVQRLTAEMESLSAHSVWLEQELKSKSDQILSLRSGHAQDVKNLQRQLDEASGENEKLSRDSALLRRRLQAAQSRINDSEKELQEVRQEATDKALENEQAAAASKKLIAIQKQKIDRLTDKYDSVCRQIEGLKQLAKVAQKEGSSDLDAREKELQCKMDEMLLEQAEKFSKQLADANAKLERANRRCEQAENSLLLDDASSSAIAKEVKDSGTMENLSLTDLYSRIATAEDRAHQESLLRKQAEIRVARIEADIRAKAPELLRQRKEYEAAIERQFEYKDRLQGALEEAEEARSRYSELEVEVQELHTRNKDLELDSIELAKQVQSLLASRTTLDGAADAIPESVAEMQSTNQRLLSEHRQLTAKVKDLEEQLQGNSWQEKAERLEEEMQALIDDRKRQEIMVEQIVEQRDLFRALVKNQGNSGIEEASVVVLSKHGEHTKRLEESKKEVEEKLEVAEQKLDSARRDSLAMSERLSRYETVNVDLSKTVDNLQSQLSAALANTAKLSVDSDFQKNKSLRTESICQQLREELSEICVLKDKLQLANHSLQDALSKANSEFGKIESELEETKVKLRVAESQSETARKAEERASNEAKQLRMELTRQDSLSSSIQRIEATLAAKNKATEESYKIEVKELSKKLSDLEEDHASEVRRLREELNDLENRLKWADDSKEKAAREVLQAEKKLLEASLLKTQVEEKNASLESELSAMKEKFLLSDKGHPVNDLSMRIDSLTEKYNSMKKENESLKEQINALKEVSKGSEDAVVEMTNALKVAKSSRADELSVLEGQLRVATVELEKMKQVVADLTRDLSNQRAERDKAVQDGKSKLIEAESRIAAIQSNAEAARLQCKELDSEIAHLRLEAANAQQNYERELNLHSQARTDLRTARQDAENQRRELSMAEIKLQNLGIELSQEKTIVAKEKADLEARFREQEKALEESRVQNAILHDQLEKIGDQIEDMQGGAMSLQGNSLSESATKDVEMQKTMSELREVIKFVRSEKEVIRVQLDAARRDAERDRAAADVARRSLDSLRAEIRQMKEIPVSIDFSKMKSKLNDAEKRCQLLEESNTHLRDEMKACQQKITNLSAELDASKKSFVPLQMKQRDIEAKNAELESEKASLKREVDDWKGRVQALVTQFNQIDPIEHQKVLKELDKMKLELEDLARKKIEAEDESRRIRQLAGRASKELQQNKQLVEKQKKMISDLTEEKDDIVKLQKGNKLKDLEELRSKISQLEDERNNAKKLLSGASEMNEKLRERLRQFQKVINESKKKEALLHSQLEQARSTKGRDCDPETNTHTQSKTIATFSPQEGKDFGEMQHEHQEEKSQEMDSVGTTTQARTSTAIPNVPLGGFMFGPSQPADPTFEASANDESSLQKDVVVEVNDSEEKAFDADENKGNNILNKIPLPKDDPSSSSKAESAENSVGVPGRFSGERKELSMKEKLMERKRKLMMDMQLKQEALRKTQDEAQIATAKEEPPVKRTKVMIIDSHRSESLVDAKEAPDDARVSVPTTNISNEPSMSPLTDSAVSSALKSDDGQTTFPSTGSDKHTESGSETNFDKTSVNQHLDNTLSNSDQKDSALFGSAFLNIKPPGSSAPKFQFGSSNAITLPTPSTHQTSNIFNAFSTAPGYTNGGVSIKPLFATGEQKDEEAGEGATDFISNEEGGENL